MFGLNDDILKGSWTLFWTRFTYLLCIAKFFIGLLHFFLEIIRSTCLVKVNGIVIILLDRDILYLQLCVQSKPFVLLVNF